LTTRHLLLHFYTDSDNQQKMSTRSRLKKLFHRGDNDDETSSNGSGSSPVQQSRYEGTSPGQSPRVGQRPLSGTGERSSLAKHRRTHIDKTFSLGPASPSAAHGKARQSTDRRSMDSSKMLERRSIDGQSTKPISKDRQPPMIPPMPAVDHSFDTPPAVPQHTAGGTFHSTH